MFVYWVARLNYLIVCALIIIATGVRCYYVHNSVQNIHIHPTVQTYLVRCGLPRSDDGDYYHIGRVYLCKSTMQSGRAAVEKSKIFQKSWNRR